MNYWNQDERKGRKCWEIGPVSILTGQEKNRVAYGGKKCVFRPERNVGKEGQERSAIGNKFQMVGAAKVNERRPFAERMSGTVRRCLSRDRRFLEGVYGVRRSDR